MLFLLLKLIDELFISQYGDVSCWLPKFNVSISHVVHLLGVFFQIINRRPYY